MSLKTSDDYGRARNSKQHLLERMGGEPVLGNIIKNWYQRIFEVEDIKHFFRNADMRKIASHQYEFL
jgi:truncated hemoglobin YjbI